MNDRILVPLDGSVRAEQILVQVARLLRREDADVMLLRVAHADADRTSAAAYLAETVRALEKQGVRARPLPREGSPAEAILRAAVDEGATLIAISTHGRSGAARWLWGSVAEKVLRAAPVPVLLMRSFQKGPRGVPLPAGPGEIPFRRLLVPTDGSDASLHVLPAAASFAKLFGAEVDVLRVEEPPLPSLGVTIPPIRRRRPGPGREATASAKKAVARFREYGVRATPRVDVGDPAALILETAESKRADLIAMATHGRTGMSRWALGSVTERVLRHSTLPMLVVRSRT